MVQPVLMVWILTHASVLKDMMVKIVKIVCEVLILTFLKKEGRMEGKKAGTVGRNRWMSEGRTNEGRSDNG